MTDLAVRSEQPLALLRPVASPRELLQLQDEVAKLVQEALTEGVDYGTIPGTDDKPSLFKPGAERINLAFGAHAEYSIAEKEIDHDRATAWVKRRKIYRNAHRNDKSFDWVNEEGTTLGLYRYVTSCRIVREGRVLAEAIGSCSTLESKYISRPRDCENTVLKMAQKRAYVSATLHAYALSNRFTADVEDRQRATPPKPVEPPPPRTTPAPPTAAPKTIDAETIKVAGAYDDDDETQRKVIIGLAQRHGLKDGRKIMELRNASIGTPFEQLDRAVQAFVAKQGEPPA